MQSQGPERPETQETREKRETRRDMQLPETSRKTKERPRKTRKLKNHRVRTRLRAPSDKAKVENRTLAAHTHHNPPQPTTTPTTHHNPPQPTTCSTPNAHNPPRRPQPALPPLLSFFLPFPSLSVLFLPAWLAACADDAPGEENEVVQIRPTAPGNAPRTPPGNGHHPLQEVSALRL